MTDSSGSPVFTPKFVPKKWGVATTNDKILDEYESDDSIESLDQDVDCPDACDVDRSKEFIPPVIPLYDPPIPNPLEVNVERLVQLKESELNGNSNVVVDTSDNPNSDNNSYSDKHGVVAESRYENKSLELYAKVLDDKQKLLESCEPKVVVKQGSGFAEDLLAYFRKKLIECGREPYRGREMEVFERICSEIPKRVDRIEAINEFCECSDRTQWYTEGNNEFAGHGYGAKSLIYLCDRIWFKEARDKEIERVASIERRKSQDLYHYSNNILAWNDLNDSVAWFKDQYGDDAKTVIIQIIKDAGRDLKDYDSVMGVLDGIPIKPCTREEAVAIGMQFEFYREYVANKLKTEEEFKNERTTS